jgi:transcriptional regulator
MYQPAAFVQADPAALHALMRGFPLATLVHAGADGLTADHLPLELDADAGVLRGHVARANPLWRRAAGQRVLAVFHGPQGYVSPGWYPAKAEHGKVVPTWNYAVVHAHGTLRVIDDADWLRALVGRLTDRHEAAQARPWAVGDAPPDYLAAMLAAIVGIELPIERLEGKWKLSQNRAAADRRGVVAGLGADPMAAWVGAAMKPGTPR